MSDMAAYVGDKLLNWIKGTAMGAAPSTIYVSLWNGDPEGAGAEVTGTHALTTQSVSWGSVGSRALSSNADIAFGTSSGADSITYVALADSATYAGSNHISRKSISTVTTSNGLAVKISSGNLTLSY